MTQVRRVPPGRPGHWLTGNLAEYRRDPLGFMVDCAREYGPVCSYRILRVPVYLFSKPEHIEQVQVHRSRCFTLGRTIRASRPLLGIGLLTSEGEGWARRRRMNQPAFRRERIGLYAELMGGCIEEALSGWKNNSVLNFRAVMSRLTQQILARALFGIQMASETDEVATALQEFLEEFRKAMDRAMLIPQWLPTAANRRTNSAVKRLEKIVYSLIARKRADSQPANDLLSMLLRVEDDEGPLTDHQLRDEVMTLLLAGHATTAVAVTWIYFLLARHPECQTRLVAEVMSVTGGRKPVFADLAKLRFTANVIKEALRLYPPAWVVPRVCVEDCEIGGWPVPRGTSVVVSQWVTHRDPQYFERPEQFDPDRWTPEFERQLPRFAYFPFGGGPRMCIGENFAITECLLLIAAISQKFWVKMISATLPEPLPSLTLYPKHGVDLQVEELSARLVT